MQNVTWRELVEKFKGEWQIDELIFQQAEECHGLWVHKLQSFLVTINKLQYNVQRTPFEEFLTKQLSRDELKMKVAREFVLGTDTTYVTGFHKIELEQEVP